jgi:inhibitor of nuclear factor kappa-B kinase subunit alpha
MVFGLVASNGMKMPPVFLETGFRMGAKEYLDRILVNQVLPWVQSNFPNNNGYVFMQDGAPCHTAKSTQNWLGDHLNFWSKETWPPSSPDLNPLDFSIWAYVQARACAHQHSNIESLKESVSKEWSKMPASYIRTVCSKFRPRIEAVIEAGGGYID